MTVNELVEEIKVSQGFLIFVSYLTKDKDGELKLNHRYLRQQLPPEDIGNSLKNFNAFILKDLKDSSALLSNCVEEAESLDTP